MQHTDEIINYLQANEISAKKLDRAFNGVSDALSHQIEHIGSGVQRALYYTSCFTEKYQEVCQKQKVEDVRFAKGVYQLLSHGNVVIDMLKIYFDGLFRFKTDHQLEWIKNLSWPSIYTLPPVISPNTVFLPPLRQQLQSA